MTLDLIGKDLVLEASTTKIEDKQVPGISYIYIYYNIFIYFVSFIYSAHGKLVVWGPAV